MMMNNFLFLEPELFLDNQRQMKYKNELKEEEKCAHACARYEQLLRWMTG